MWNKVESIRGRIRGECLTERPAGSFTITEYCARYRVSINTGTHQLDRLRRANLVRKSRVLLPDALGRMVMQNVYTPAD